jgi:hypothetical protein
VAGWDMHTLESAASRRTPRGDICAGTPSNVISFRAVQTAIRSANPGGGSRGCLWESGAPNSGKFLNAFAAI